MTCHNYSLNLYFPTKKLNGTVKTTLAPRPCPSSPRDTIYLSHRTHAWKISPLGINRVPKFVNFGNNNVNNDVTTRRMNRGLFITY